MTPERWRQVTEIFHAALARDVAARGGYLAQACADDPALRDQVDAMLAADSAVRSLTGSPLAAAEARPPRLASGCVIDQYRVERLIGAGGMGEVYRAHDTKLGRDVAIKVLPTEFIADAERLARFEREARVLAALNHPHIAAIYGFEEHEDLRALILELVDGETLSDRVRRGAIPLHQALPIARQIADALDAAHQKGIVHRDLKPANIKIMSDGTAKVLDFGLARAFVGTADRDIDPAGPEEPGSISQSPAGITTAVHEDVILGTAAYMSPEQARGQRVDKRADIWAFGCVFYEMLTGTRAFDGADTRDTLARVLIADPDWTALPRAISPVIRKLLQRCLERDLKRRLHDIADACIELDDPADQQDSDGTLLKERRWLPWAVVGVAGLLVMALTASPLMRLTESGDRPVVRFSLEGPGMPNNNNNLAVSPDGRKIVFVAQGPGGQDMIFLRSLDTAGVRPVSGTEACTHPFWSPDSRYIGCGIWRGNLKKVDVAGELVQILCGIGLYQGGTWNANGVIVFSSDGRLFQVAATGGPATPIPDPGKPDPTAEIRWPYFLPDGIHYLYTAHEPRKPETRSVYVASLNSGESKRLAAVESMVEYAPPGFLVFRRDGALFAQPFDVKRLEFAGRPERLADDILYNSPSGRASFSAAHNTLIYRSGSAARQQLFWMDRNGKSSGSIGALLNTNGVRLSPDGKRIAFAEGNEAASFSEASTGNLWIYEIERNVKRPLTNRPAINHWPVWSPDGMRLAFDSSPGAVVDHVLYEIPSNGASAERILLQPDRNTNYGMEDWSEKARAILFSKTYVATGSNSVDLWVLPLEADRKPFAYRTSSFRQGQATFSPNGRWVSYVSNETGTSQVVVQSFPDPSRDRRQISREGGAYPRWKRDGRELYYVEPDGQIVAVAVRADERFEVGKSTALFKTSIRIPSIPNVSPAFPYDVSTDGQRFLVLVPLSEQRPASFSVVLNWTAELIR